MAGKARAARALFNTFAPSFNPHTMNTWQKILCFLCFVPSFLFAQAPVIQWQNTIGGRDDDALYAIDVTSDGGYIVCGYSYSDASGDKTEGTWNSDYWILKLDATGNIQWQNTIAGPQFDVATDIRQTRDGGYIVGGYSNSNAG